MQPYVKPEAKEEYQRKALERNIQNAVNQLAKRDYLNKVMPMAREIEKKLKEIGI